MILSGRHLAISHIHQARARHLASITAPCSATLTAAAAAAWDDTLADDVTVMATGHRLMAIMS